MFQSADQTGHPLDGPRLKLKWASKHVDLLDDMIRRHAEMRGYEVVPEVDTERNVCRFRLRAHFPIFLDAGLEVGEALYQLRSCLDHLVWQLAKSPSEKNQFPILAMPDPDRFNRWTHSVPDPAKKVIERFQPYKWEDFHESLLWALNELSRWDKHRIITPTIGKMNIPSDVPGLTMLKRGSADDQDVVAEGPIELCTGEQAGKLFTFGISLQVGDFGSFSIHSLRGMHDYISGTVLPAFEPFFT